MTFERFMVLVICVLMFLTVIVSVSGCAMLRQVTDVIFNIEPEPIETPKPTEQLWQTVKKSNWLVTLAIPIIALGVVAMFNGAAKLGMSAIIFGSVNLFMALATSRFAFWMGLFGLVGSVAAVAFSILVKNTALKELIFNIQKAKENVVLEQYTQMTKQILSKQTNATKKIVAKIKTNAKLKGEM